jgi:MFS family permease
VNVAGRIDAAAGPKPRAIQAAVLLTTSGLTALVTAVLGPSLPKMQAHFSGVANADYWVPLSLTMPMLVMACLSIFAGALSDKLGRKRLLVAATALYTLFGTAPLYLDSLSSIVASRVGLGVVEAAVMTISTCVIGDYYQGAQREKFMSLQTTIAASLAFMFNVAGGLLGEFGWRTPYATYAIGAPLAVLMAIYLWEPVPRGGSAAGPLRTESPPDIAFQPRLLFGICLLAVVGGTFFLIVPVHLGYLFEGVGVHSSSSIGLAYALNSVAVVLGTLCFGWLIAPRLRVAAQLALYFSITAAGCLLMDCANSYGTLTLAAMLNGFGAGLMLPTLVTWNMRTLPFARRGLGTGAFQSCLFLGMFFDPPIIVALGKLLGSRAAAVGALGAAVLLGALIAIVAALLLRRRHAAAHAAALPMAASKL